MVLRKKRRRKLFDGEQLPQTESLVQPRFQDLSQSSQAQPSQTHTELEPRTSQQVAIREEELQSSQQQVAIQKEVLQSSQQLDSSKRRKVRGPTNCNDVYNLQNERIVVKLNEYDQPVDDSANTFSQFLGTVARNGSYFPIDVTRWRSMSVSKKEAAWTFVKTKFDIGEEGKRWTFLSLCEKWRNWKYNLKIKYYNPQVPIVNQSNCPDKRVAKEQWMNLLHFWESEESKKLSEINKGNRAKKVIGHSTGTKSFARLRYEEEKKGKKMDRAKFFVKSHTRKDGSAVDQASAEVMKKLEELSKRESLKGSQGSTRAKDPAPNRIFNSQLATENKKLSDMVNEMEGQCGVMLDNFSRLEAEVAQMRERMLGGQGRNDTGSPMVSPRSVNSSAGSYTADASPLEQDDATTPDTPITTPHHSTSLSSNGEQDAAITPNKTSATARHDISLSSSKVPRLVKLTYPGSEVTVARAFLISDEPSKLVGGMQLRVGWVEVLLKSVSSPKTPLLRPQEGMDVLQDAMVMGVTIAWIKANVQYV